MKKQKNKGLMRISKHRIKCRWIKWRGKSGILVDKRILMKLKGKFYKSVVRFTTLNDLECWMIDKKIK